MAPNFGVANYQEGWTKTPYVSALIHPEGEYTRFKPAWAIHVFGTRRDVANVIPEGESDDATLKHPDDELGMLGGDVARISLGRLTRLP